VLKGEIVCDMITELICGGMTPLYRKLYDEGLVSPGFSGEFLSLSGANCMVFGGETSEPEKVRDLLLAEIARVKKDGVDKQLFALCKNMMYGELVSDLENIDDVASGMASAHFKNRSQADEIAALAMLEAEDVNAALASMLCEERSATVIIRPAGQEQE
jgi:predicted Zn-dependent peptidase